MIDRLLTHLVYSGAMGKEQALDTSIFEKESIKGKGSELFGKEGEIIKSGRYYSLNRGQGIEGYRLVVLDTREKTLTGYFFSDDRTFLQHESGIWTVTKHSFDPGMFREATLFSLTNDFITRMEEVYPELGEDEANRAKSALREAVKPLLDHYKEKKATLDYLVGRLSGI